MMLLKMGKSHSNLAQLLATSATTKFRICILFCPHWPGFGSENGPRPTSLYAAIENSHRSPQNGLFIAAYGSVRFVVDAETDFWNKIHHIGCPLGCPASINGIEFMTWLKKLLLIKLEQMFTGFKTPQNIYILTTIDLWSIGLFFLWFTPLKFINT